MYILFFDDDSWIVVNDFNTLPGMTANRLREAALRILWIQQDGSVELLKDRNLSPAQYRLPPL